MVYLHIRTCMYVCAHFIQVVIKIHRELIFAQKDLMEAKQAEKV